MTRLAAPDNDNSVAGTAVYRRGADPGKLRKVERLKTAVVIVAAGKGSRAANREAPVPKQYRPLGGVPVLNRTLSVFAGHDKVGDIVAVIHGDERDRFAETAALFAGRLLEPAIGGVTRQESVLAGLEMLEPAAPDYVLIHDAARPFVSPHLIDRVVAALQESDAVVPALPVSDTLKREEAGHVVATIDRSGLWAAQTPQGFRFKTILDAHRAARKEKRNDFTDDAAIAEWHGSGVVIADGERNNVKLTTAEDFAIAEQQFTASEIRVGQGFDVHAFGPGDHVVLCGVKIPHSRALTGHSDADVGLHALTDALLGAIGDGDIGTHFAPDDPQWRGVASEIFLSDAAARVHTLAGTIVNVDITLICEEPKIGPHRAAMVEALSTILQIAPDRIGVKATTTEGLGFTGRGEGIAATATATIRLDQARNNGHGQDTD